VASTRRPRLVVYHAPGCGLCEPALTTVAKVAAELGIEARHREWLPVVEIDGARAFVYFVQRDALLERLREAG